MSPQIAASLVRLVTRAEAMGLIDPAAEVNAGRIEEAMGALEAAGIGSVIVEQAKVSADPKRAIDFLIGEVEHNPVPRPTLKYLSALLGLGAVAGLTGMSEASARRYLNGERDTPDPVALRLHTVAMIVADLLGSYNAYGIRRWFSRTRSGLSGRAPSEILRGRWDPDDDDVQSVRQLATDLTAPLAS